MSKYRVVITETLKYVFDEIEAESESEAQDIAYNDELFTRSVPTENDSFAKVEKIED